VDALAGAARPVGKKEVGSEGEEILVAVGGQRRGGGGERGVSSAEGAQGRGDVSAGPRRTGARAGRAWPGGAGSRRKR